MTRTIKHSLYDQEIKLDFDDVTIEPRVGNVPSRSKVDLISKNLFTHMQTATSGIVAANMDGVGTIEVAKVLREYGCMTALHKHYEIDDLVKHFSSCESSASFYSMGMSDPDYQKFIKVFSAYEVRTGGGNVPFKVCVDVANGYMRQFGDFCRELKKLSPDLFVMAGNVVTIQGVNNLKGVDVVKCGIGSGAVCKTRTQTGIGYPQLSCIYDLFNSEYYEIEGEPLICSDGGCNHPGDISKALVAGADMVMLGSMLAGTDEGGGDIIEINGQKFVEFYGMSSATAQKKHNGGLQDYRSSEGRTTLIPYKGPMASVISNILGGIRSTGTYVGADHIDQIATYGRFQRVNNTINRSLEKYTVGN